MSNNYITMTALGNYGRFANCIFQAAFLRIYADRHGLIAQAPRFAGQQIFDFEFEPISVNLPQREEKYVPDSNACQPIDPSGDEYVNKDSRGYAQYHTNWYRHDKQKLLSMFRPNVEPTFTGEGTRVGIHSRWGDYDNRTIKWRTPVQWYVDWLNANWKTLADPVLFVAAEEPGFVRRLEELAARDQKSPAFQALMSQVVDGGRSFTEDWVNLRACDIVLMPNSTFSFSAAWLNPNLLEAWRANLAEKAFVRIDPWNATPLGYEMAENHRHLLDPL
jgi:hypothetical protein